MVSSIQLFFADWPPYEATLLESDVVVSYVLYVGKVRASSFTSVNSKLVWPKWPCVEPLPDPAPGGGFGQLRLIAPEALSSLHELGLGVAFATAFFVERCLLRWAFLERCLTTFKDRRLDFSLTTLPSGVHSHALKESNNFNYIAKQCVWAKNLACMKK